MVPIAAVILTDSSRATFAGLDLNERAAHIAHRAGIFDVHFAGATPPAEGVLARLRAAGWRVTVSVSEGRPLEAAPLAETVVVLPARTIVEPAALVALIAQAANRGRPALVVTPAERRKSHALRVEGGIVRSVMGGGNAVSTGIAILPEPALARVRRVWSYSEAIHRLAKRGTLGALATASWFCVPLDAAADVRALEQEYAARTGRRAGALATGLKALAASVLGFLSLSGGAASAVERTTSTRLVPGT